MISYFLKIAVLFFSVACVWGLASFFFPNLNFRTLISGTASENGIVKKNDILPSPRKYQGLFSTKSSEVASNTYVPKAPYSGYAVSPSLEGKGYTYTNYEYLMYTSTGTIRVQGTAYTPPLSIVATSTSTPLAPRALLPGRSLYVRNLSIYEGGHIYTGLSFIGEARSSLFKEGKFPIVMVDTSGKMIGVSAALAENDWTVPGWVRFRTKIEYPLPKNMACTMVFEEALLPAERSRIPVRVPLQVQCN
jgi:hypothetical protein